MELKPNSRLLMRREIYTLLTITIVVILGSLIIQALVVNLDNEVTNVEFVQYVWSWVAGGLITLWVFAPWLFYLWIINLKYSIEDERVVVHKGIITKKSVSIPYSAITDFTLSRSLYERWLGIGTLMIQTAGQSPQGGSQEGKLEGLTEFDSLHTTLRAKVKAYRGSQQPEKMQTTDVQSGDVEVLQSILEEVKRIGRKLG
ncbi:MAG: PH domain-containing protein [Candidatus Marinimicrobia bacterium]|nr:PH domain-containing protein [Candidatus Neomarinimicrobiota bacterium]